MGLSAPKNSALGNLIIGYTTHKATTIWVRSEKEIPFARVKLYSGNEFRRQSDTIKLSAETDYTAVVTFDDLEPETDYGIWAWFASTEKLLNDLSQAYQAQGKFRTFPNPNEEKDQSTSFSFLLGSCNLSNFTINSFLALLLGLAGMYAMTRSLNRPPHTWDMDFPDEKEPFLRRCLIKIIRPFPRFFGCLSRYAIIGGGWFAKNATKGKQPGQPMLRSPFLKLSAVLDPHFIISEDLEQVPSVGDVIQGSISGAIGVVAFSPVVQENRTTLVLTHRHGKFEEGEELKINIQTIGRVVGEPKKPEFGYDKPAFLIHAGDLIYFDFPFRERKPRLEEYRRTYRETWFEDDSIRHFLAHYPNFMTLDDHEIFDQFANDQRTPLEKMSKKKVEEKIGKTAAEYLKQAKQAYWEYVHSRQSEVTTPKITRDNESELYYKFNYGNVHYFVLDTRTKRWLHHNKGEEKVGKEREKEGKGQMISDKQMEEFCAWLKDHREDLKFVVSSVPFIAEVREKRSDQAVRGNGESFSMKTGHASSSTTSSEDSNDKWSGPSFKEQREEIIGFIYQNDIKRLVFLVGDMHCSYHATMRVGDERKYECKIIHELAGGPFHQLQLASLEDFAKPLEHTLELEKDGSRVFVPYKTRMERFYSGANTVLHIKVNNAVKKRVDLKNLPPESEIEWKVIRTMTDPGPAINGTLPKETPAMSGRIRFIERQSIGENQD